jgi:drug/metabolite transporter (DMT)-like permease
VRRGGDPAPHRLRRAGRRLLIGRPVPLVVAGAVCIAFSGILVRLADVEPSTAAFYRCAFAVPPLAALAYWERRRYGSRGTRLRMLAWVAGAFFAADLILWHHSIEKVGAGLATVLGNVQVVLVPLTAWLLLRERPTRQVLVAVPIVLAGVVLISGVIGTGAYGDDPTLGAVFGIFTAIAYAGFLLVLRAGSNDARRSSGALFHATLASAIVIVPAGLLLGELDFSISWEAAGWLLVLALTSQVLGWLLITAALPQVPASLSSVVLTLQPVMAVVLAMILVDEDPSTVQLLGILVVVGGIVLATARARRAPEPGPESG